MPMVFSFQDGKKYAALIAEHDMLMVAYEAKVKRLDNVSQHARAVGLEGCQALLNHAIKVLKSAKRHRPGV